MPVEVNIRESHSTFTALGIRFWDPLLDQQIRRGLCVQARPAAEPHRTVFSRRTASDVYAFPRLPGMRAIEFQWTDVGVGGSPPVAKRFVVDVEDVQDRYVPVAFDVLLPLPAAGVFPVRPFGSPGHSNAGLYLFSSPNRRPALPVGVVRGELAVYDPANPDLHVPASHALVVVDVIDSPGGRFRGLADEAGRFVVHIPYPAAPARPQGSPSSPSSPPASSQTPFREQTWAIAIQIHYSPATVEPLPGVELPEYRTVLRQTPADIWDVSPSGSPPPGSPPGGGVAELPVVLHYGEEIVLRTQAEDKLFVTPVPTSP